MHWKAKGFPGLRKKQGVAAREVKTEGEVLNGLLQSAALRRMLNISVRYSTCGVDFTPAFAILVLSSSEAMKARAISTFSHSNIRVSSLGF